MLKTVEGIYRDGKIELLETAPVTDSSRVIVTFLPVQRWVDLAARGIKPEQAGDLRA